MSVQTGEERKAAVKRSRTGCLTCRKRKKKCPEEWQDGTCLRCLHGGWHCLPPGPPSHSSNRSRKSGQSVSRAESTPTVLGRSHPSGGCGLGSLAFITNPYPIEQHNGYQSHSDDSHSGDQSMDESESPEFSHAALFPEAQEDHVLDEFYESHLLPSWASTYPQTVAENMMIRLSKTTLHHPVARLARHAASAAYLTAYRAERDAPSLKGCRMSGKSALTDAMKQFPIDPHHLLQKAIHGIEQPLTESELTPELTLWILAHLHWAGVAIADTPTRQRIMSVADRLVLNTFGERSMLDLASLQGYSTICLKWYAVADISRSLAQGRKTTLDYIYTNRKIKGFSWDPLQDAENEADGSHDLYFGLSGNLLALVFDSSTLIAQALQLSSLLRLPPTMLEQAERLILNLYDWRPDVSIYQENTNRLSLSYGPEISCNQELWRLVTILMLKIYVCRCSVAEEVIQELIMDGVDLVSAMIPLAATRRANSRSVVDLWTAFNAQPTFLLGGFLQNAADRRMVKRFIDDSGPEMALNDMKALLQATWAESDRTGSFMVMYLMGRRGCGLNRAIRPCAWVRHLRSCYGSANSKLPLMSTNTVPYFSPGNYATFFLAGGACACLTHGAVTPIDVVKTTIQIDPAYKGKGLVAAGRTLVAQRGPSALLTGFGPTAVGYLVQGGAKFAGYEYWKRQLVIFAGGPEASVPYRTSIYLLSASIAEFFADILLTPLEATRIRLVSERNYASGLITGFTRMAREGGIREFYSGFVPILFKQIPFAVGQFTVNEQMHEFVNRTVGEEKIKSLSPLATGGVTLGCGVVAGASAAILSQPADTLLSQINKGKGEGSVTSRLAQLAKQAGPAGLFAGLGPRILMTAALVSGQFLLYDMIKQSLGAPKAIEIHKVAEIK